MYGIAGVFDQNANLSPVSLNQRLAAMAATMVHHGPDNEGSWSDPSGGVVDDIQRVINGNCQTLGFETHGFETEYAEWKRILRAVEELQRADSEPGARVH